MALPDAAHPTRRHLQPAQDEFLGHPHQAVAGMGERVVEHRRLDLGRHPVGVRAARAGQAVDQPVGAIGLEVAPDLVELLAAVAHHLAGPADVAEFLGEFEQAQLAPCYLLFRGHVALRVGGRCCSQHHQTPPEGGMTTPDPHAGQAWPDVRRLPSQHKPGQGQVTTQEADCFMIVATSQTAGFVPARTNTGIISTTENAHVFSNSKQSYSALSSAAHANCFPYCYCML